MTDEHVRAKHPVVSLLGGALGGGFAGGFLWFFLDNIVRINGQGWLQRLPWPVPGLALFVAAGAVLGGVTGLVRGLRERARVGADGGGRRHDGPGLRADRDEGPARDRGVGDLPALVERGAPLSRHPPGPAGRGRRRDRGRGVDRLGGGHVPHDHPTDRGPPARRGPARVRPRPAPPAASRARGAGRRRGGLRRGRRADGAPGRGGRAVHEQCSPVRATITR